MEFKTKEEKEQFDRQKELYKEAHKEMINEWLEEKFSQFGKWSAAAFGAMIAAAVLYFTLWAHGWKHP